MPKKSIKQPTSVRMEIARQRFRSADRKYNATRNPDDWWAAYLAKDEYLSAWMALHPRKAH